MSKYECDFTLYVMNGYASICDDLCPEDYLDCKDERELRDAVTENLNSQIDIGFLNIKDCDVDVNIPKEFINEWKKLKGYE